MLYPAEVYDDSEITESNVNLRDEDGPVSFIRGWNFVTDLYRILERYLERIRRPSFDPARPERSIDSLFARNTNDEGCSASEVLAMAQNLYDALPIELKEARPATGDDCLDRYGFQGAVVSLVSTLGPSMGESF